MDNRTQEISLKVDNGGSELNYDDMQYLLKRSKDAVIIMQRIAMISKNANDSERSAISTLNAIRDLTSEFLDQK